MNTFLTAAEFAEFSEKPRKDQLSDICEYILKHPIIFAYHPKLVHMAAAVLPSLVSIDIENKIRDARRNEEQQTVKMTRKEAMIYFHGLTKKCTICGADHLETYCTRKF